MPETQKDRLKRLTKEKKQAEKNLRKHCGKLIVPNNNGAGRPRCERRAAAELELAGPQTWATVSTGVSTRRVTLAIIGRTAAAGSTGPAESAGIGVGFGLGADGSDIFCTEPALTAALLTGCPA